MRSLQAALKQSPLSGSMSIPPEPLLIGYTSRVQHSQSVLRVGDTWERGSQSVCSVCLDTHIRYDWRLAAQPK